MTNEQLAYEHAKTVGWNEAIDATIKIIEANISGHIRLMLTREIRKLDRSIQVIDD